MASRNPYPHFLSGFAAIVATLGGAALALVTLGAIVAAIAATVRG